MKKTYWYNCAFTLLIFTVLISSCSRKFYAPTTTQTPLFREKGEAQISANIATGEDARCAEFQAGCAITSRFAVLGSYYMAEGYHHIHDDGNGPFESDPSGKGSQFEMAFGYYKAQSKSTSFETYLGFANGRVVNYYDLSYRVGINRDDDYGAAELRNKILKPFAQFNIGYRSPYLDCIFSTRLGLLHCYKIMEKVVVPPGSEQWGPAYDIPLERLKTKRNSFLFEPGITVRYGYEPIKLQFHLGLSLNHKFYNQENFILSFGLVGKIFSSTTKQKWNKK